MQLQKMHPTSQAGILHIASQQLSHAFQLMDPDSLLTRLLGGVLSISFVRFNSTILHWKRLIAEENINILLAPSSHT